MSEVNSDLESKVNEIFIKTIVTQKFKNPYLKPLELKIYVDKNENILFSSFQAKIGDSIMVKSKLIKKEKAEVKYTDSISSGNAAIFVSEHDGKIIINMGNIPSKEEVIFISEFIHFTKYSHLYEFKLLENLPIFKGKDKIFYKNKIKGKINIKTRNKIFNIQEDFKNCDSGNKIIEEKYLNEDKNEYLIVYENLNSNKESDGSTTIFFDTNYNEPLAFLQKSSKLKEENYIIQCKIKDLIYKKEKEILPELYIFLIDQSFSIYNDKFAFIKEALEIFLQSLPANSYYQFVGYGTKFIKYDDKPKKYIQENINESLKLIKNLKAELGINNIYDALFDVGCATYENLNVRKNIFLLTDGKIKVKDRKKVLDFIENNNSLFRIFSIGVGDDIDEEFIKRIGSIGSGGYDFCKKYEDINSVVDKNVNNVINPWIHGLKIKCCLDNDNIYEQDLPKKIRQND
jgi:hypothetical protein